MSTPAQIEPNEEMAYAITISPRDREDTPQTLYDVDKYQIKKCLNRFSKNYTIYSEFSETGRLHYHGIFYLKETSRFKFNMEKWRLNKIGYTCIKVIKQDKTKSYDENYKLWHNYCLKDYNKDMETYFPIITYGRLKSKLIKEVEDKTTPSILQWLLMKC